MGKQISCVTVIVMHFIYATHGPQLRLCNYYMDTCEYNSLPHLHFYDCVHKAVESIHKLSPIAIIFTQIW